MEAQMQSAFDDEDKFLTECESVADAFIFLSSTPLKSQLLTKAPHPNTTTAHVGSVDPRAKMVAEKLKQIGDIIQSNVESGLSDLLPKQSIMEIGLIQFTEACRSVLSRYNSVLKNGWQQVSVVYSVMNGMVASLYQQRNVPDAALRQRQKHFAGFVGPALQDLELSTWIAEHGGLQSIDVGETSKVPI